MGENDVKKSLKKEQLKLLQLEKQVVGLAAGIATLTSAAKAEQLLGQDYTAHSEKLTDAYLNLVQTLQAAHDALGESAAQAGVELLKARGLPKDSVMEAAKSVLGIG